MDRTKAAFFDTQVDTEWASANYTLDELDIINKVISSAGIGTGMNILEPGCGTGRLTEILARWVGPFGSVTAVDMSRRMMESCAMRTAGSVNVRTRHGALEDQSLPHGEFDFIVLHNMFHHLKDKYAALSLFASVMKDGGDLLIFHFLNWSDINDEQRKIHPSVRYDTIPPFEEMRALCNAAGMTLERFSDNYEGYLLQARTDRIS